MKTTQVNVGLTPSSRIVSHPLRIQRKRVKGWRMPSGVVYVGRPTKWGNPFIDGSKQEVTALFKQFVESDPALIARIKSELRGKQLACWCSLSSHCHADVLAQIANQDESEGAS